MTLPVRTKDQADEYEEYRRKLDELQAREKKAEAEGLDAAGRKVRVGDRVAYGISIGRSSAVQIGTVVGFSKDNGRPRVRIDERFRKSGGSTKKVVTLQYFDRMVILAPVPEEPFKPGDRVKTTTENVVVTDWMASARERCKWGAEGVVVGVDDHHGLWYEVTHDDDESHKACYDPTELERC